MINYKKTYKESTSWRHWRLSCLIYKTLLMFTMYNYNWLEIKLIYL